MQAQVLLGWIAVLLGAIGVAGTLLNVLRSPRARSEHLAILGMAAGAMLGGWGHAHLEATGSESLRNIGTAIFCVAGLLLFAFNVSTTKASRE